MRLNSTLLVILLLSISLKTLSQDGALDQSFGNAGRVTVDFNQKEDNAFALGLQSTGKIIVAGYSFFPNSQLFSLARLNQNGSVDSSYGTNGRDTASFSTTAHVNAIQGLVIGTDDKIIVAGRTVIGSTWDFAVAKFKVNGGLDSTFGANGKVALDFFNTDQKAYAMLLQPDQKIVVGGWTGSGGVNYCIARLKANGTLDSSFGTNGVAITDFFVNNDDVLYSLVLQSDGKIVAFGSADIGATDYMAAARYKPNGKLDSTFGTNGEVTTLPPFGGTSGWSCAIQSDGKIIGAGVNINNGQNFILARYTKTGGLDEAFGNKGIVTTKISTPLYTGNDVNVNCSIVLQPDGKILLASGKDVGTINQPNPDFLLVRYKHNGTIDSTFGDNGFDTTDFGGSYNWAHTLILQKDEKILVAGYVGSTATSSDFAIARYNNGLVLPLSLLNFTAQQQGKQILLQWQTANELNMQDYVVEKSTNGKDYSILTTVTAKRKSVLANTYNVVDVSPASGTSYYRLKMINNDGSFSYSNIIQINIGNLIAGLKVFPNPTYDILNVEFTTINTGSIVLKIADATGKIIQQKVLNSIGSGLSTSFNIQNLSSGVYYLTVEQNGKKQKQMFIVR